MNDLANPLISVVIPTYNHARYLGRALQSVLDQTYINWEAIVIDNHSTDHTDEVMANFKDPRITYLKIHNNGVIAASRNAGIRAAKGRWIAFLDSDDWWKPSKLELSSSALNAGADLVFHDLHIVRSHNQAVFNQRIVSTEPKHPMFITFLCDGVSMPNSSVVVSTDLLFKIGGLSEKRDLISVEDHDTWIKLSRLTEKFIRIPDCLGYYWVGGDNISSASVLQCERISALYNQYFPELNDNEKRRANGFLAYRIARIAQNYGDFSKAIEQYKAALALPLHLNCRAKALYFLMRAKFISQFRKYNKCK
jgi:glycosyltransferase involved in cell wall biosynthesis